MIAKYQNVHDAVTESMDASVLDVAAGVVFLPLEDAVNKTVELTVKEGDRVLMGQVIGTRKGAASSFPIVSSVSGTYLGNEKHLGKNGRPINCAKIENDGKDEAIAESGLTDVLSAIPAYNGTFETLGSKLTKDTVLVIVNGMDAEPGSRSDEIAMKEENAALLAGMQILTDKGYCVKLAVNKAVANEIDHGSFDIVALGDSYLNGWDIQLARKAAGFSLKDGETLASKNTAVINVMAIIALGKGTPMTYEYVTVAGDALASSRVCRVKVGTPVKDVIAALGGYAVDGKTITLAANGLMMGTVLPSDDLILLQDVKSFNANVEVVYPEEVCIRCGACALSCPVSLSPMNIMYAMKVMPVNKDRVKSLKPLKCIECGLCTYSCPSHIKVADMVKRAKVVAKL